MIKTGDVIDFFNSKIKFTFIVEVKQPLTINKTKNVVSKRNQIIVALARPSNPYSRLCINQSGDIDFTESTKASSMGGLFVIEFTHTGTENGEILQYVTISCVNLRSQINPDHKYYLTLSSGKLGVITSGVNDNLKEGDKSIIFGFKIPNNLDSNAQKPCSILPPWQYYRLLLEGYIIISNVVPNEAVDNCLRVLNHELGVPGSLVAGGFQPGLGKLSGSLSHHEVIKTLLTSKRGSSSSRYAISPLNIIEELFGEENSCEMNRLNSQIAFRFPEYRDCDDDYIDTSDWHTDGYRQGKEHGFSLLLGVCLSDTMEDFHGNLLVWPGSHLFLHKMKIGEHGEFDLVKLKTYLNGGISCNSSDLEDNLSQSLPSLGDPLQVHLRKGDIVILHPDLAHTGGPNTKSCEIRRMIYFRLRAKSSCMCICENKIRGEANTSGKSDDSSYCCHVCKCKCKFGFRSWQDIVSEHRGNMWADIRGVDKYRIQLEEQINML